MSNAFWSLWVCLLLTAAAHARTNVYKCVDGPHPVYQQTPCQGRAEWRWEVPPEPPSTGATVAKPASPASSRPRVVRQARARAALISISADPAACERARQQRAKVLANGKRMDFVQRRQLDDAVHEARR